MEVGVFRENMINVYTNRSYGDCCFDNGDRCQYATSLATKGECITAEKPEKAKDKSGHLTKLR